MDKVDNSLKCLHLKALNLELYYPLIENCHIL